MVNVQRFQEPSDWEDANHLEPKNVEYVRRVSSAFHDRPRKSQLGVSAEDKIEHKDGYDVSRIKLFLSKDGGEKEMVARIYRSTRRTSKRTFPYCDISIVTKDDQDQTKAVILAHMARIIEEGTLLEYLCK